MDGRTDGHPYDNTPSDDRGRRGGKKTMEKALEWVNANARMDRTSRYSEITEFHQYYTQDVSRKNRTLNFIF